MSNDFKELETLLGSGDYEDVDGESEDVRPEFNAPVVHEGGTSLEKQTQDEIDDFNYVRKTLLSMIDSGQKSLEAAVHELMLSGHPRAAEVVGSLIKNIGDVSDKVLDLHAKMKEKKEEDPKQQPSQNNSQTNIFIGSPSDLLDVLEKIPNKKEEFVDVEVDEINEDKSL